MAPLMMIILALVFTGSQYMDAVVGLNGAARAGTIIAANYLNDKNNDASQVLTPTVAAVNSEWGTTCDNSGVASFCFTGVSDQASCAPSAQTPGCVWLTHDTTSSSGRTIEVVHVSYQVVSYLAFVPTLSVTATSGATYQ